MTAETALTVANLRKVFVTKHNAVVEAIPECR